MRSLLAKIAFALVCVSWAVPLPAVTVKTWEEDEPEEFEKGKCDRTVISSLGKVLLGREETEILQADDQVDFVNALALGPDGVIYAATGPNGLVYRIDGDKAKVLCKIKDAPNLFSLLIAPDGGVLVGTGGEVGRIYKVTRAGEVSLWFDPDRTVPTLPAKKAGAEQGPDLPADKAGKKRAKTPKPAATTQTTQAAAPVRPAATSNPTKGAVTTTATAPTTTSGPATTRATHPKVNYIWAMARGAAGQVYAATGAAGWLLEISPNGKKARVVFDSKETNLLSLAIGKDGRLYAGSDKKGLVYRVDPKPGKAFVMYDTGELEISAIALDAAGNIYAATAAAAAARPGKTAKPKPAGRPGSGATSVILKKRKTGAAPIARSVGKPVPSGRPPSGKGPAAKGAGNAVYRIAPDGMVTEVFREPVMILDMVEADGVLYLTTGNEGRVFQVRPDTEEQISLAKVKDKQVTAVVRTKTGRIYLGTSNKGRVVKLSSGFAAKGTFVSTPLDAKQISRWGRLQWEGELRAGTGLSMATRSGNVSDPEEGTWDAWSKELDARQGAQIPSPSARFIQYRLTLTTKDAKQTPEVRGVELARQSNNLPPKVTAVEVGDVLRAGRSKGGSSSSASSPPRPLPPGTTLATRIVKWKAQDPNGDRMLYDIYFRIVGHKRWILLKEDNKTTELKWDTSKVADGRYEIRVVAKDAPGNPPLTALSDDRISDILVIDNNPPVIGPVKTEKAGKGRVRVHAVLADKHSPIAAAHHAVDSHDKWVAVLAEDDLFDALRETISFELEDLEPGEHVVTIRARDAEHNWGYTTVVVDVDK